MARPNSHPPFEPSTWAVAIAGWLAGAALVWFAGHVVVDNEFQLNRDLNSTGSRFIPVYLASGMLLGPGLALIWFGFAMIQAMRQRHRDEESHQQREDRRRDRRQRRHDQRSRGRW